MARQIAQEDPFTLAVWNRTAKKAADFAGKHRARHAETPADAARGASVVVTCLPTSADVEALLDGPNGLINALLRRKSTVVTTFTESLATYALGRRIEYYDKIGRAHV